MTAVPLPDPATAGAIIVLFNPDPGIALRIERLVAQFATTIVVDNTPGGAALPELGPQVQVVRNMDNLGIATALNQGLALASHSVCTWVCSFDQDTDIAPDYLATVSAIAASRHPRPVLVGANYTDAYRRRPAHPVTDDATHAVSRVTLISSGMLMPVEFAIAIGGFREDYFIDSVDHEFCLRASARGAHVLLATKVLMTHRLGGGGMSDRLRLSSNHPPFRKYYIARNTLATARAHAWRHPLWALRQLGRLLGEAVSITLHEPDRGPKLRAFARGLWHGAVGRSGMHG